MTCSKLKGQGLVVGKVKRAAGYIRVSRLKNDEAVSPENQKEKILQWAKLMDIDQVDFYIDLDYSGKNTERPEFQKMMKNLASYTHVVVYKLTRFSRSTQDFHENIKILEQTGVDLVSVSETIDTSTPVGRLIRNVLVDFGEFEREIIGEQVKDNMHKNAANGNWNGGHCPYGFSTGKDKVLVANDNMQNVQYVFDTIAQGYGANTIRAYFAQNHIKSPTGKNQWSKNTILGIVRNPIYKGMLQYSGQIHTGRHKQYIDDELFDRANRMLACRGEKAPRTIGSKHLLSGLIKCPICGKNLHIRYNGRGSNLVRRYVCAGRNDYINERCNCHVIDADSIENTIIVKLLGIADSRELMEQAFEKYRAMVDTETPDIPRQKKYFQGKLKKIKSDMDEMFRLFRGKVISEDQLKDQNQVLLMEQDEILKELELLDRRKLQIDAVNENMEYTKDILSNIRKLWDILSPQEKREMVGILVKEVGLTEEGANIDCYYFNFTVECQTKNKTTMTF